jgi:hypothetical protein
MTSAPPLIQALLSGIRGGKSPQQGDGYQDPRESNPTPIQNSPTLKPRASKRSLTSPNVTVRRPLRGVGSYGQTSSDSGVGTKATGFVTAAELPPEDRRCDRCKFMVNGSCTNKQVMNDPDIPDREQRLQPNGTIRVAPDECCNLVESKRKSISALTPRQRAMPGTVGGTNPGSQPAGANSNGPLQPGRIPLRSPGSVQ